jgi:hypothetical protein
MACPPVESDASYFVVKGRDLSNQIAEVLERPLLAAQNILPTILKYAALQMSANAVLRPAA